MSGYRVGIYPESDMFGVFGVDSGVCHEVHATLSEAFRAIRAREWSEGRVSLKTPEELISEATTICEAATPGPWSPIDDPEAVVGVPRYRAMRCPKGHGGHGGNGYVFSTTHEWHVGMRAEDSAFIATARTLVPELAAALGMAHSRIAQLASESGAYANSLGAVSKGNQPMEIMEAIERVTRERDEARAELAKLRLVTDELISVRRELAELRLVHLGESKVG